MATSQSLRTPLVNNAVSFLRDANTQQSPLEKRVEFLRAKGLTNEEMDEAFRQVGMSPAGGAASFQPTADAPKSTGEFFSVPVQPQPQLPSYQMAQQIQYPYGASYPYPPPQPVEGDRDWRDWFIMAVVSGSVMMGVYSVARKYLFPHLVPPPLPAFQQSQQDLQAQFDAIQKQLDEMSLQTESQTKIVETQRDEVTKAVGDVERALREMEEEGEKSKDELKEIREEVAHIRELVPKVRHPSPAVRQGSIRSRAISIRIVLTPFCIFIDLADRVITSSCDINPLGRSTRTQISQGTSALPTPALLSCPRLWYVHTVPVLYDVLAAIWSRRNSGSGSPDPIVWLELIEWSAIYPSVAARYKACLFGTSRSEG
ncbi:peroxisomal membrane protein pex14 [Tulasnella sp. JGI-2019a]|nr:peroxisomal membrane protein pex14 [Tulasnella sp. JGI-2019a]